MDKDKRHERAVQLAKGLPRAELELYITETLSPELIELGLCEPDVVEDWLDSQTFLQWYLRRQQRKAGAALNSAKRPRSRSPSPDTSSGRSKSLSAAPSAASDSRISQHTPEPPTGPDATHQAKEISSEHGFTNATPVPQENNSNSETGATTRKRKKRRKRAPSGEDDQREGKVQVTRELWVDRVIVLTEVPQTWSIPEGDENVAYVLDLRSSKDKWMTSTGELMGMPLIIKSQDSDSWVGGSGGGKGKTTKVVLLDSVECQVASHDCGGCLHCSEMGATVADILEQCKRFSPDYDEMRRIFDAERDVNASDSSSSISNAISFWRISSTKKCPAKIPNEQGELVDCPGKAEVRAMSAKTKAKNRDGKTLFIGCELYMKGNRLKHRHDFIPKNVSEGLIEKLFKNDGKLDSLTSEQSTKPCARVLSVRTGSKGRECPYSHLRDGQVVVGKFVKRACNVKIRIYYPVDTDDLRAVVYFPKSTDPNKPKSENGHNHPVFPRTKVSKEGTDLYGEAIKVQGTIGLTITKLDNAASTRQIFGGKTPAEADPGLADNRRRRDILKKAKKADNPHGTEVEAVFHELKKDLAKPLDERYIHKIIAGKDFQIVVTMVPGLATFIHSADMTLHDNTYKRVFGKWKEWEIVIWEKRLSKRVTVARIYTTNETRVCFGAMWAALWDTVEEVTEERVNFKFLDGKGLKALLMDGCKEQVYACGDDLVKRALLRQPEPLVKEIKSEVVVEYIVKTCDVHLGRKFTELAKTVPEADMNRIRSITYLKTKEEIHDLIEWCKVSEHKAVRDWILDKVRKAPWFVATINPNISKMDPEDWLTTPDHTNLNESAHPFTNMHTGTNLALSSAIETARRFDFEQLALLEALDSNCVLSNNHNTQHERNRSNAARAQTRANKVVDTSEAQRRLRELAEEQRRIKAASGIKRISPPKKSSSKVVENIQLISDVFEDENLGVAEVPFQDVHSSPPRAAAFDDDPFLSGSALPPASYQSMVHAQVSASSTHTFSTPSGSRVQDDAALNVQDTPVSRFLRDFGPDHSPSRVRLGDSISSVSQLEVQSQDWRSEYTLPSW